MGGALTLFVHPSPRDMAAEGCALIAWSCSRLKRVVKSTFSGELMQQVDAFDRATWMRMLYQELTAKPAELHMRTDCNSVVENTQSLRVQVTEKRLTTDVWMLRQALVRGEITSLAWVDTSLMLADGLAKPSETLRTPIVKAMKGLIDRQAARR